MPAIRTTIARLDRDQPIERIALGQDLYADLFGRERFILLLMSVFSGVAILLAAAGIFGVLSQSVALRTREIGIRVALGAEPRDIRSMFVSHGLLLAAVRCRLGRRCLSVEGAGQPAL
jgi:ABC-type lipoprotein release transport system permease subunit